MIEHFVTPRTDKPWGYELLIAKTDVYVGKVLHVTAGQALSLQYHERKDETIYLHHGNATMVYHDADGKPGEFAMNPGDSFHIPPHSVHRLVAVTDCDFFEVSTPQLDDVVRLQDQYGRQGTSAP